MTPSRSLPCPPTSPPRRCRPRRSLGRLLALVLALPAACTIEGSPGLDHIESVGATRVIADEIHPGNCGHAEVLEIEVTNVSPGPVTVWADFELDGGFEGQTAGIHPEPVRLEPGESTVLLQASPVYYAESGLLWDLTGAERGARRLERHRASPAVWSPA